MKKINLHVIYGMKKFYHSNKQMKTIADVLELRKD